MNEKTLDHYPCLEREREQSLGELSDCMNEVEKRKRENRERERLKKFLLTTDLETIP